VDFSTVTIIGAGVAGLAAGERLSTHGLSSVCLESRPHWGGHCASDEVGGYVFDEGPHVSFTRDAHVQSVFERGAERVRVLTARLTNYFGGRWAHHPAQCHLHGLPADLVADCVTDLAVAQQRSAASPAADYATWCMQRYGRTFAERFVFEYTRKYWTVEPAMLDTEWIGDRMYVPSLRDVVRGSLTATVRTDCHYLQRFRYPWCGGFQSFLSGLRRAVDVRVSAHVREIDLENRHLLCADGSLFGFDHLISSMPLPELIATISAPVVPMAVREAAASLEVTSVLLVDLALAACVPPQRAQIFYVYDRDISVSRVSFPHLLSPRNAPRGFASAQAEVYYSRHRPLDASPDNCIERVIDELQRMKVIPARRDVLWARARRVPYANVLFTAQRVAAVQTIRRWLATTCVLSVGRYGEWAYFWSDDAARSGWAAADQILAARGCAAPALASGPTREVTS